MALADYGTRMPAPTFSSFSFPRGFPLFRRKVPREVKMKQELQNPSTLKTISVYMVYGVCECAQATHACGGQVTACVAACVAASAFHLALSLEVLVGFFHCLHLRRPANFQGISSCFQSPCGKVGIANLCCRVRLLCEFWLLELFTLVQQLFNP